MIINKDIPQNALKNQWDLETLIFNRRQLEAAAHSAKRIKADKTSEEQLINRLKKSGRCRKANLENMRSAKNPAKAKFINCSSKNYKRNKYCPVYGLECFDCHKKGHFRGVKASEQGRKYTHRVESESDTSNSEYGATDSDNDSHQDKQTHSTELSTLDVTILSI